MLLSQIIFISQCHIKRMIGGTPSANPSFGMATTKILRYIFPRHSSPDFGDSEVFSTANRNLVGEAISPESDQVFVVVASNQL